MSLNSFLSKIFGNKSQRDLKEIQPIIDKIKVAEKSKNARQRCARQTISDVRADIKKAIETDETAIAGLQDRDRDPASTSVALWDEIDRRENILTRYRDMSQRAPSGSVQAQRNRRNAHANRPLRVTATRWTAIRRRSGKEFVSIEGDKGHLKNHCLPEATRSPGIWSTTTCSS